MNLLTKIFPAPLSPANIPTKDAKHSPKAFGSERVLPGHSDKNAVAPLGFIKQLTVKTEVDKPLDPTEELRMLANNLQQKLRVRAGQLTRLSQEKEEINGKYQSLKMEYSLLQQDLEDARKMNKNLAAAMDQEEKPLLSKELSIMARDSLADHSEQSDTLNTHRKSIDGLGPLSGTFHSYIANGDDDIKKRFDHLQRNFDELINEKKIMQETILNLTKMLASKDEQLSHCIASAKPQQPSEEETASTA